MSSPQAVPTRLAVLLAAGRGSRLRPHTDTTPKPLLPWQGRATLDHVVEAVVVAGVRDVVLVTHHLADQIDRWAEQRQSTDIDVQLHSVKQRELAGTADALQAVADALPDLISRGPFVLSATDYLVQHTFYADLLASHTASGLQAAVSLKHLPHDELASRSSVRFASGAKAPALGEGEEVLEVVEKPLTGQAPSAVGANLVFVLPPDIIKHVRAVEASPRGEREVQSALNAWLATGGRCHGLVQPTPMEWSPTM